MESKMSALSLVKTGMVAVALDLQGQGPACTSPQNGTYPTSHKQGWKVCLYKTDCRASLVAQWLRICLPMQGTRVRALVWEDPTCRGAAGPVSHNY